MGFWVHGLCIIQEDMVEKNSQVRLMSCIYSQAMSTVVWLGTPTLKRFWSFWETISLINLPNMAMKITGRSEQVNLKRSRSGIGNPSEISALDHTSEEYRPFKSWL
jgi:hypothetical protein